jgi:hypothetical protein
MDLASEDSSEEEYEKPYDTERIEGCLSMVSHFGTLNSFCYHKLLCFKNLIQTSDIDLLFNNKLICRKPTLKLC